MSDQSEPIRVSSSAWTGDLSYVAEEAAARAARLKNPPPLTKTRQVLAHIFLLVMAIVSWTEMFNIATTGEVHGRHWQALSFAESPIDFCFYAAVMLLVATLPGLFVARVATSREARHKIAANWRNAPW